MIKDLIDEILRSRCGLDLHGVFVVDSLGGHDVREACRLAGLDVDEVQSFTGDSEASTAYYQSLKGDGYTSLVSVSGVTKPVIFVQQTLAEDELLSDHLLLGVILHELGHADDMIQGHNFGANGPMNLAKAEAYAEVFCLRKLNASKDGSSQFARNLVAKRVFTMKGKGALKSATYDEVIKVTSRKKLALWAKDVPSGITFHNPC